MASAGRPFTDALVTRVVTAGVQPAPVTLIRRRGEPASPSVERFCRTVMDVAGGLYSTAAD